MKERDRACERFDADLESYLDGGLEGSDARAFESHVESCAACSQELMMARRVHGGLRSLPRLEAPASAVHAVLSRIREEGDRDATRSWAWLFLPRPATIAATVAVVLLAALAVVWLQGRQPTVRVADDARSGVVADPAIARATLETKLALAHFANASRKVGRELGRDLLHERALAPIGRSLSETLDLGMDAGSSGLRKRG